MADGLLLTTRERLRIFWAKLAAGVGPTLALSLAAALTGGGAAAVAIAVLGVLCGLVVATSARRPRGALTGGVTVAVALLVLQLVIAWFASHPILKD
ncbi:MAG: hypothetical protein ABSB24_16325 [Gaiellaceae bacterium]|jgi:hypothetical protein